MNKLTLVALDQHGTLEILDSGLIELVGAGLPGAPFAQTDDTNPVCSQLMCWENGVCGVNGQCVWIDHNCPNNDWCGNFGC